MFSDIEKSHWRSKNKFAKHFSKRISWNLKQSQRQEIPKVEVEAKINVCKIGRFHNFEPNFPDYWMSSPVIYNHRLSKSEPSTSFWVISLFLFLVELAPSRPSAMQSKVDCLWGMSAKFRGISAFMSRQSDRNENTQGLPLDNLVMHNTLSVQQIQCKIVTNWVTF